MRTGEELRTYLSRETPQLSWAKELAMRLRILGLLAGFFLAFSLLVSAQSATTSLRGTVTDTKGAVLQGAS
jgi:hypothetical protein